MKKSDIILGVLFLVVVSFGFLIAESNKAIGQTTSSSSSSSGTAASSSSSSSSGEVASSSSSSSGEAQVSSSSSSSSGEVASSSSSSSGEIVASSSSSGGSATVLSPNFAGIWKAKVKQIRPEGTSSSSGEVVVSSSSSSSSGAAEASSSSSGGQATRKAHLAEEGVGASIITFKLCVKDGKLEGTVQQGGAFLLGRITSQTIISDNEVEFTVESKDGKTAKIRLKLLGERQLRGTFADGHTFEGRKLNENRSCLAPGKGPGPRPSGSPGPGSQPKGPKGPHGEPSTSSGSVAPSRPEGGSSMNGMGLPGGEMGSPEGGHEMSGMGLPGGETGSPEGGHEMGGPPPFAMGGMGTM